MPSCRRTAWATANSSMDLPPFPLPRMLSRNQRRVRPHEAGRHRPSCQANGAEMRTPGPDHPIAIAPNPKRVRVMLGGKVVADTRRALTLQETSLPPVQYIPREDVDFSLLRRTDH